MPTGTSRLHTHSRMKADLLASAAGDVMGIAQEHLSGVNKQEAKATISLRSLTRPRIEPATELLTLTLP